jgi:hypothetical protein
MGCGFTKNTTEKNSCHYMRTCQDEYILVCPDTTNHFVCRQTKVHFSAKNVRCYFDLN